MNSSQNNFQMILLILVFFTVVPLSGFAEVTDCTMVKNGEAEAVSFLTKIPNGEQVPIDGVLMKPDGKGPFPGMILLHGEFGIFPPRCAEGVLRFFVELGYVSLLIDSASTHRPTRYMGQCVFEDQAQDAHKGRDFLTTLPYVIPEKIGVIGWWVGGAAVIDAVSSNKKTFQMEKKAPFRAAVAIYPLCFEKIKDLETPFLIFIGEKDTRASAIACRDMKVMKNENVEYQLIVYPNVGHLYDFARLSTYYDEASTQDTYDRLTKFFAKYLQR